MTIKIKAVAACAVMLALSGCATTQKVTVEGLDDSKMSCQGIRDEYTKLDTIMAKAEENKGVTTTNVMAALFFWPAAVGNVMDADKAQKLVEQRRTRLDTIYKSKACDKS